jgi:hypothetical protein
LLHSKKICRPWDITQTWVTPSTTHLGLSRIDFTIGRENAWRAEALFYMLCFFSMACWPLETFLEGETLSYGLDTLDDMEETLQHYRKSRRHLSAKIYSECFPSVTRRRHSLLSVVRKTLGVKKHSAKRGFCQVFSVTLSK